MATKGSIIAPPLHERGRCGCSGGGEMHEGSRGIAFVEFESEDDMKKAIQEIEKKLKEHKKENKLAEEAAWELQDKLADLNSQLEGLKK